VEKASAPHEYAPSVDAKSTTHTKTRSKTKKKKTKKKKDDEKKDDEKKDDEKPEDDAVEEAEPDTPAVVAQEQEMQYPARHTPGEAAQVRKTVSCSVCHCIFHVH